ncbi:tetratricopeptide repeat protein [Armatimonas sp.]|uniref:tetratricopeptide repeat protein n=1 Tax=Armatimonas sp. TaxID=1872638 RepID=UPI00286AC152|nr:tetratricopeptide repeat protein [Armatimonas sp.]
MKRSLWLLCCVGALVGCEGKRETPKLLNVALPGAAPVATPAPLLFADIFRRRRVPPGTDTNVDRVETKLMKSPQDPKALKAVGLAYYSTGGYDAAIKKLSDLSDPEAQLYLGYAHMGLGNYPEALEALGKLHFGSVSESQYGESELEQGNLYFQALKQDDKAEQHYVWAIKESRNVEAIVALGLLYASQGKTKQAQGSLLGAVKELPAGKLRATAFAALGRLESDPVKAREWYEKTRSDDPENAWLQKLSK